MGVHSRPLSVVPKTWTELNIWAVTYFKLESCFWVPWNLIFHSTRGSSRPRSWAVCCVDCNNCIKRYTDWWMELVFSPFWSSFGVSNQIWVHMLKKSLRGNMRNMSAKLRIWRRRRSSCVCKFPCKYLWQMSAESPLRIAEMGKSGEPRILQIAIPIFNGMTALDAIGPYNVLQLLPNVNIVFVSHSKGLCRDRVLAMEATASFDEVAIPNPLHDHVALVRMCLYRGFYPLMMLRRLIWNPSVRHSFRFCWRTTHQCGWLNFLGIILDLLPSVDLG